MVEISSGSLAPPQSAISPPTTAVTPPGLNDNDEDERAVRKAGESDTGGGESQTDIRARENAEADRAADDAEGAVVAQNDGSGSQVDITV